MSGQVKWPWSGKERADVFYCTILSLYERGKVRHKINYLTLGSSVKTLIFMATTDDT